MKYILKINALLFAMLLLVTGCRMTSEQYQLWERYMARENHRLEDEIRDKEILKKDLEEEKARKETEKKFLMGKSEVLIRENAKLDETWDGMGADSHEVMMNLFSRIHDSEMAFYNVRIGNPPMPMTSTLKSEKYTVLVDMERTVQEDCSIQMGEFYSSKEDKLGRLGMVCFVILNKNEAGKYNVRSSSGYLMVRSAGLNRFSFTDRPLDAKKGDRYGIILTPGASIDYDELDTGSVCVRKLDSIPEMLSKLTLSLEAPAQRGKTGAGSMEMALMMRGTSGRKSMFVVDGRRFFSNNKLLSKVLIDIKTSSEKPLSVYFAVLCRSGSEDYYVLRDISPIAMVTPGEQKELVLPHTKKEDGHQTFEVHKGDIFALLLPGVYDMTKVKADFGMFKTVVPFDYSKPYFKKSLSDLKRETNDSKELRPDLLFVSFKVE